MTKELNFFLQTDRLCVYSLCVNRLQEFKILCAFQENDSISAGISTVWFFCACVCGSKDLRVAERGGAQTCVQKQQPDRVLSVCLSKGGTDCL